MTIRHFLDISAIAKIDLEKILKRAHSLKKNRAVRRDLHGKALAMVFEKSSTRTRVSFELGMKELGGHTVVLSSKDMHLGESESIADTARVLGRFVHAVMIRTFAHDGLLELAKASPVPVINGLTNTSHPCQLMADLMTVEEKLGRLKGLRVAWCGDGNNNVLNSWIEAAGIFDFSVTIACPPSLVPEKKLGGAITVTSAVSAALQNADVVITDTWVSMHNKDVDSRRALLAPYQVNDARMGEAAPKAIFLHCLPAHRGEEVTDSVIDGPQSAVWDEAENRLHIQKAILLWCLGKI